MKNLILWPHIFPPSFALRLRRFMRFGERKAAADGSARETVPATLFIGRKVAMFPFPTGAGRRVM